MIYDTLTECLWRVAGIRLHQGKTRVWNKSGIPPPDVHQMGPETWQPEGIEVLGTPMGSTQYTHARMQEGIADEQRLWNAIPHVPDLQCAWQLLLQSAGPRANHTIRTLPPESSHECALEHDAGMWRTALALLGEIPGTASEVCDAEESSHAHGRSGSAICRPLRHSSVLGLVGRRAPMINQRNPSVADMVVARLSGDGLLAGCLAELHEAGGPLEREGFWWKPSWSDLQGGARPTRQHGWQYWSSSVSDAHFRERTMLAGRTAARRAHLRSHSGGNAGVALAHCPTAPEFTIPPHLFRTLLLERLQLPLQITEAECEGCQAPLDPLGRHRASCTRSGRVKRRATAIERMTTRVFREAGACVRQNVFLRDMNINVPAQDSRHIEVLAQDLPCFAGAQVAQCAQLQW